MDTHETALIIGALLFGPGCNDPVSTSGDAPSGETDGTGTSEGESSGGDGSGDESSGGGSSSGGNEPDVGPECDVEPILLGGLDGSSTWRLGDVDGDGKADLVSWASILRDESPPYRQVIRYHLSTEGEPWGPEREYSVDEYIRDTSQLYVRNFTGDHKAEVMVLGEIHALVLTNLAEDPERVGTDYPAVDFAYGLGVLDYDGDGYADVVKTQASTDVAGVTVARADGEGGYGGPQSTELTPDGWSFVHFDVDATAGPWFWAGMRSGEARRGALFFVDEDGHASSRAESEDIDGVRLLSDFDADGTPELVVSVNDGPDEVWQRDGNGLVVVGTVDPPGRTMAADVDGDGFNDLVSDREEGTPLVWLGGENGLGDGLPTDGPPMSGSRLIGLRDVDGDGVDDVVVSRDDPSDPSLREVVALQLAPIPASCD